MFIFLFTLSLIVISLPRELKNGVDSLKLSGVEIISAKDGKLSPTVIPDISVATVAVGYDGEFFDLTLHRYGVSLKEFNKMMKRENIFLDTEEKVLQICKLYLLIEENSEYDVFILQNASDIPCVKNTTKYKEISPPFIHERDGIYHVELYSWKELGGELIRWEFLIERNGEIKSAEKYIIDRGVGCALSIR